MRRCLACSQRHDRQRGFCSRRCRRTYRAWMTVGVVARQQPVTYLLRMDPRGRHRTGIPEETLAQEVSA